MQSADPVFTAEREPRACEAVREGAAVELDFLEAQHHYRLLFGHPEAIHSRAHPFPLTTRTAWFKAGARFGLELWTGNLRLTPTGEPRALATDWRVLVLEVGAPGARVSRVPRVRPGAHVLVEARGTRQCPWLLSSLAELERLGDLADLPREFFLARDQGWPGLRVERTTTAVLGGFAHGPRG